jgi:hypothetical protein
MSRAARTLPMLAAALVACSGESGRNETAAPETRIECRSGADAFARHCTVTLAEGPEGRVLVVRKPDGGFRRLRIARDGRGVVAADGAEPARVRVISDRLIEVAIGDDAYLLPARVMP